MIQQKSLNRPKSTSHCLQSHGFCHLNRWLLWAIGFILLLGALSFCGHNPSAQTKAGSSGKASEPNSRFVPCPQVIPKGMSCIPGGRYLIGSAQKDFHKENPELTAFPTHTVTLSTFLLDKTEVTTAQYQKCVRQGECSPTRSNYPHMRHDLQPQLKANWYQAQRYCRAQGKRLPTEAEFEAASRGPEGDTYPWGNAPATCKLAIIKGPGGRGCQGQAGPGRHPIPPRFRHTGATWDVASRPTGRYGLYDMSGNAQEWVQDWYVAKLKKCGKDCHGRDPQGPCAGADKCTISKQKLVKGGSWYWGPVSARAAARRPYRPDNKPPHHFGFRCAKTAKQ